MKILITDDSKATRMRLGIAIEDRDHEIVTAINGREALEILQSEDPPEIAFVDWEMPEMEGLEVVQLIRKQRCDCDIHQVRTYIILITARSTPEDISTALVSGADDYMTKPWNKQELNARLEVAERTVSLQQSLKNRVFELESILHRHNLQGEIPQHLVETDGSPNTNSLETEGLKENVPEFRSGDRVRVHVRVVEGGKTFRWVGRYSDDFLSGFTLADCPTFDDWQRDEGERLRILVLLQSLRGRGRDHGGVVPAQMLWGKIEAHPAL